MVMHPIPNAQNTSKHDISSRNITMTPVKLISDIAPPNKCARTYLLSLFGSKFREMRAILVNCPIDYSEEPLFTPSEPLPSSVTNNHPMKPRINKIVPSPRECVEVSPPPSARPRTLRTSTCPKVTWKDSVTHNRRSTRRRNSAPRDLFRIPIVTD